MYQLRLVPAFALASAPSSPQAELWVVVGSWRRLSLESLAAWQTAPSRAPLSSAQSMRLASSQLRVRLVFAKRSPAVAAPRQFRPRPPPLNRHSGHPSVFWPGRPRPRAAQEERPVCCIGLSFPFARATLRRRRSPRRAPGSPAPVPDDCRLKTTGKGTRTFGVGTHVPRAPPSRLQHTRQPRLRASVGLAEHSDDRRDGRRRRLIGRIAWAHWAGDAVAERVAGASGQAAARGVAHDRLRDLPVAALYEAPLPPWSREPGTPRNSPCPARKQAVPAVERLAAFPVDPWGSHFSIRRRRSES